MKTIAVVNAKGGTGKTSLAVNLSAGVARMGKRTLLVDLDPQGNSTAWFLGLQGIELGSRGTAEALHDGRITDDHLRKIQTTPGLDLLPCTPAMSSVDHVLGAEIAGEMVLRRALNKARRWDYVFLDCPPNIGVTVLSALCAADGVVAPVLGAFLSLAGLRKLEETVEQLRDRLDVKTSLLGYVLFAADPREAITKQARELLQKEARGRLFQSEIRVSTAAKTIPSWQQTVWDDGADDRGAEDYKALLQELLEKLESR